MPTATNHVRQRSSGAHENDALPFLAATPSGHIIFDSWAAMKWFLFVAVVVLILFVGAHIGICSGDDPHAGWLPEPFRTVKKEYSATAQLFSYYITRLEHGFALERDSLEPGAPSTTRFASTVQDIVARMHDYYTITPMQTSAFVTESCAIVVTVAGVELRNPSWLRVVKSTCRTTAPVRPTLTRFVRGAPNSLQQLPATAVILLFQAMPFPPLTGDAFLSREAQPMVLQVDIALWGLLENATVLLSATASVTRRMVTSYSVRPTAALRHPMPSLVYVAANLDSSYYASDNWGSLALLLQLMHTLRTSPVERARTAFLFGHSDSGSALARMGLLPSVLDLIVVSGCGLPNGRNALYHNQGSIVDRAMGDGLTAILLPGQDGYLSGRKSISDALPVWDLTSFSPHSKTLLETLDTGGVAGLAVLGTVPAPANAVVDVSVQTLIAQLLSLQWLTSVGARSGVGLRAMFPMG
jgi:hypothetical protein